jgi:hypothetical protein
VIAARRRIFVPYAVVMTLLLVGGLIWFVSFERTALQTIPRQLSGREGLVTVSEDVGNAADGEALWRTLPCRECHGDDARGTASAMNVSLAGIPLPAPVLRSPRLSTLSAVVRRTCIPSPPSKSATSNWLTCTRGCGRWSAKAYLKIASSGERRGGSGILRMNA